MASFCFCKDVLLILDLSPEAATRGILYKKLFFEILQYSQEKAYVKCAHTDLDYFLLLTCSRSQNFWSY